MKIGLISDTHLPQMGREPPPQVALAFAGVDLILHAGDIYSADCLDWLERIAPVLAVEVAPAPVVGDPRVVARILPGEPGHDPSAEQQRDNRVIEAAGHAIGLVHDLMIPRMDEIMPGRLAARFPADRSLAADLEAAFGRTVSIVVFGHTHRAMAETHQGILLVNPGSPTLPNQLRRLGTVGLLEITPSSGPVATIIELSTLSG